MKTSNQTLSRSGAFLLPSKNPDTQSSPSQVENAGGVAHAQHVGPAIEPEAKTGFVPRMVSKSQIACWMSIMKLVSEHPGDSWLWTFTFAEVLPFFWAGNVHRNFTRAIEHAQRGSTWPKVWGAVKVAEEHESGHGIHFHWVCYPRLNIRYVMAIAQSVGFGRINVHPEPATPRCASYLSKYLVKGKSLPGIKAWSCLGDFEGVRVQDVDISSPSIDCYRAAYREAIAAGKPKGVAFIHAKNTQRKFDTQCD